MKSPWPEVPVQVKRLRPDVHLPVYAHEGDAGFDLCAAEAVTLAPGHRAKIPTGLAFAIPPGYEIQVRPRSGLALKHGVTLLNTPGTIDAGYRGEVCIIAHNAGQEPVTFHAGDRVAQGVLARFETVAWEVVEELSETSRGDGGFGSTGVMVKTPA